MWNKARQGNEKMSKERGELRQKENIRTGKLRRARRKRISERGRERERERERERDVMRSK